MSHFPLFPLSLPSPGLVQCPFPANMTGRCASTSTGEVKEAARGRRRATTEVFCVIGTTHTHKKIITISSQTDFNPPVSLCVFSQHSSTESPVQVPHRNGISILGTDGGLSHCGVAQLKESSRRFASTLPSKRPLTNTFFRTRLPWEYFNIIVI